MSRAAKLPALPQVQTNDVQLQRWMQAVAERLEVREGSRGDPDERVVTHREMKSLGLDVNQFSMGAAANQAGGVLVQAPNGGFTRIPLDAFSDQLRKTKLYQDLTRRIDDASRFDDVPPQVRSILLTSIAEEAAARGADIRRLEFTQQSALESVAYTVEAVTASIAGVAAGVRETTYASATANEATAGKVTQVQARLDNFSDGTPGTATIEQKMTATASKTTGLEAQYVLKVGTGNKVAGIGLASSTNTAGVGTSAMILQADKFALMGPNESVADPANPPLARVPFGYDSATNTIYINGQVRINAGGQTIDTMALPGATGATGPRGSVTRYGAGTWSDASANALLPSAAVIGDTVTLSTASSATTKYWGGSAWLDPGVVIDGNLLVNGTLSADKISGGTITAELNLNSSGYLKVDGAPWQAGGISAGDFNSTGKSLFGVTAYSNTNAAIQGVVGPAGNYGIAAVSMSASKYALYALNQQTGGNAILANGNSDFNGNVSVSGALTATASNAAQLGGFAASEYYRSGGFTVGNPGIAFTHTLLVNVGDVVVRIPCFYP